MSAETPPLISPLAGSEQMRRVELTRPALLRLLDRVDAVPAADAVTFAIEPGGAAPAAAPPAVSELMARLGDDGTGWVVLWGEDAQLVVAPPFPVEARVTVAGYVTAPLRALLDRPRCLGIILLRLGGYAVGVYADGRFVRTKTGGRFVKNRHRKGGQSQRRFERIREGQIRQQFDEVAAVVRSHILPAAADLDAVVLGGDRHTVQAFLKRAPLPPPLAAKLFPRVIDVPEPRRAVLERSPVAIWTSRALIARAPAAAPAVAEAGRGAAERGAR